MKKQILSILCILTGSIMNYAQTIGPLEELFCPVDTTWSGDTLVVPAGPLQYSVLLREGNTAHNLEKDNSAPVKGGFGSLYYRTMPPGDDVSLSGYTFDIRNQGQLYLTLDDNKVASTGEGGGLLCMRIKKDGSGLWIVDPQTESGTTYNYRIYDVDALGGGMRHNGLHLGYTSLSDLNSEGNLFFYDGWAASNAELAPGITVTTAYTIPNGPFEGTSIPRYQNMGWITESGKVNGKPSRKLYQLGRADFGGIEIDAYNITGSDDTTFIGEAIYTTRSQPSVIIKAVQSSGGEFSLFAYKEEVGFVLLNEVDVDGSAFPLSFDELADIQKLALQKGATMFNHLGSIIKDPVNPSYYLVAEQGADSSGDAFTNPDKAYNGVLASHLQVLSDASGNVHDPYGRVLRIADVATQILLEGGLTADRRYAFSNPCQLNIINPYCIEDASGTSYDKYYLMINEAVPDASYGRNPDIATDPSQIINECYVVNLHNITDPNDLSVLRPFAIGPKGTTIQSTAGVADGRVSPLFLSLRYPNPDNTAPYNKSAVVAVYNWEEYFTNPEGCGWVAPPPGRATDTGTVSTKDIKYESDKGFEVWPNPVTRTLYFAERQKELYIYDIKGTLVRRRKNTAEIDIFDLIPGIYMLKNDKGQTKKIIIQ